MNDTFKSVCKICHERLTDAPDQICAKCRRNGKKLRQTCKICGEIKTSSPDGICWRCWSRRGAERLNDQETLQKAFKRTELTLIILKHRLDGLSYTDIADIVNLPVQTCYSMARNAVKYCSASEKKEKAPSNSNKKKEEK